MADIDRIRALTSTSVLTLVVVLTACGAEPTTPAPEMIYYVSIGDSYAAGDSPYGTGAGSKSTDGFAYRAENALQLNGNARWQLVNFGCSGATTGVMARLRWRSESARRAFL